MVTASVFEAKTNLSKYVASVASHEEPYIVILRSGKPVAKIVPYDQDVSGRIGIAQGILPRLSLEECNQIPVEEDFLGSGGLL